MKIKGKYYFWIPAILCSTIYGSVSLYNNWDCLSDGTQLTISITMGVVIGFWQVIATVWAMGDMNDSSKIKEHFLKKDPPEEYTPPRDTYIAVYTSIIMLLIIIVLRFNWFLDNHFTTGK